MALAPAAFYVRDNSSIAPVVFTASQSTTTLTTTGSPALAVGMVVTATVGTFLGVITAGSGNSWTMTNSATVASTTMVAFKGTAAGTVGWSSVAAWAASTSYTVGQLRRQKNIACVFTASQSTTTVTISAITSGGVAPNHSLFFAGASNTAPPTLTTYGTSTGGTGTMISNGSVTLSSQLMTSMLTPGNERVFVCTVAGTSGSTEPTWVLTKGAKTTDNTVTWMEVTGQPALNGDTTNSGVWTASASASLGHVITDVAGTHVFACTTAGTTKALPEPTWNVAAVGNTTTDNGATWTYLGLASGFAAWSAPAAQIYNMLATTWAQAGNYVYAANDHAEVQPTAINVTSINGTPASPNYVISVDPATVPPTSASWSAGASMATVGPNGLTIDLSSGFAIMFYGIAFSAGSGATTAAVTLAAGRGLADACTFSNAGTSAAIMRMGGTNVAADILLNAPSFKFGNVSGGINPQGRIRIQNISTLLLSGSLTPTTLFQPGTGGFGVWGEVVGCDLSGIGSGTIWGTPNASNVVITGCKLGASTVINSIRAVGNQLDTLNCDSAGTDYQKARYAYAGTLTTETTVVRTGGAMIDTTAVSDKIVTNANTSWINPFEAPRLAIWNATTGSAVTATVYGVYNGAALPNNDEIWMEVEYPGSASSPLVSIGSTTKANAMATAAAVTSDTSAWDSTATARANSTAYALGDARSVSSNTGRIFFCTTAGTSSGSLPAGYATAVDGGAVTDGTAVFRAGERFKLAATFTPQLAGPIYIRPKAGKTGTNTYYIDWLPVLS